MAELVSAATATWRAGTRAHPLAGDELVSAVGQLVSPPTAGALRALPEAPGLLTTLARELRAALLADDPADQARQVNALIGRYGARPYLTDDVGQPFHLHFHGGGNIVEALGGEYATALALILDGYGPGRFGQCQAHQCEAVYVDLTRNASRRYCSAACAARASTAAYRNRRSQLPT